MMNKSIDDTEYTLNLLYDFILEKDISERERKIGYMAKNDLEHKKYLVFVLNKTCVSLQKEAIRDKTLSKKAEKLYIEMKNLLIKNKPFGTNLGSLVIQVGYLD